jgi:hypothetical protein
VFINRAPGNFRRSNALLSNPRSSCYYPKIALVLASRQPYSGWAALPLSIARECQMNRVLLFPRSQIIVMIVGFGLVVSHASQRAGAQDDKNAKQRPQGKTRLDGAWRLVRSKDARTGQMRGMPPGVEMTKLLVGGRYAWTVVRDGKAISGAGGEIYGRRQNVHRVSGLRRGPKYGAPGRQYLPVHVDNRSWSVASQRNAQSRCGTTGNR